MTCAEHSIHSDDRLVAIDGRGDDTNYPVTEARLAEPQEFEVECIDYGHETNVDKRVTAAGSAQIARECQGSHP